MRTLKHYPVFEAQTRFVIISFSFFSVIDSKSDNVLYKAGGNKGTILMRVRWDSREKLSKLRHNGTKGCWVGLEPHKQIHYHINMSKGIFLS
jgi:hypothetical protein